MKKVLSLSLVFLIVLALLVPSFADEKPLLKDEIGCLSETEAQQVTAKLEEVSNKLDFDVVIVTTDNLDGKSITAYADDYFDYGGYGRGTNRDGCVLVVYFNGDYTERWISTSGYGITALTDYGIQYIGTRVAPLMDEGNFFDAFIDYAGLCDELVVQARAGTPLDSAQNTQKGDNTVLRIVIAVIVGLIAGIIAMAVIKGKYKPVKLKANAQDYLVEGSLHLTGSYDNYRTSSVTRTPISNNSSGGSSTHTSSSGRSHGGGGF